MKTNLCRTILTLALILPASSFSQSQKLPALKQEATQEVDKLKDFTQQMVDMIFSFGELGFQEFEASRYITTILQENVRISNSR
jgi:aminobenzoyl-glutamate utilization protein B